MRTVISFNYIPQTDGIFQDASIGDIKINYVITRLVLVKNEEVTNSYTDESYQPHINNNKYLTRL